MGWGERIPPSYEDQLDEKDRRIDELRAEVAELQSVVAERDAEPEPAPAADRPWRERITVGEYGAIAVDGRFPDTLGRVDAIRGLLDEAHDLAAEVERLRTPADGPLRVEGCILYLDGAAVTQLRRREADAIEAQLAARPATHDLPDGVELHRDGSLWALGRDIPDRWERRVVDGSKWYTPLAVCSEAWYEVRPPQTPPTERVPHTESVGRISKRHGRSIGSYHGTSAERWVIVPLPNGGGFDREDADADGTVEVLA